MPEEWFDVAYINFDEAILHGRMTAGRDQHGCRTERDVRQVLTDEQKDALASLEVKQRDAMQRLLRSFIPTEPSDGR